MSLLRVAVVGVRQLRLLVFAEHLGQVIGAEFEEVEESERSNPMETKDCECGCGEQLNAGSPWKFKRGHKPKGGAKRLPPPASPSPNASGRL